jgi:threonine aldolase
MGAVLAGSRAFLDEAWYWKRRLGGALRQAGVVAAGASYVLEHRFERLVEDHEHAWILAHGLAEIPGVAIDPAQVEANIMLFDVAGTGLTATEFVRRLQDEHGVRFGAFGPTVVRAITHLDVRRKSIDVALDVVARELANPA